MRRRVLFAAVAALLTGAPPALASHGTDRHWAGRQGSSVAIVDRSGEKLTQDAVAAAVAAYNALTTNVKVRHIIEPQGQCGTGGPIVLCLARSSGGLTQYAYTGTSHLEWADIYISATDRAAVVPALVAHEVGHALGLEHRDPTDARTTTMTPTVSAAQTKPDAHDGAEVDAAHGHTDARAVLAEDAEEPELTIETIATEVDELEEAEEEAQQLAEEAANDAGEDE